MFRTPTTNGRRTGRPTVVDADKPEHANLLRAKGFSVWETIVKTGPKRTTLYRQLSTRSPAADVS